MRVNALRQALIFFQIVAEPCRRFLPKLIAVFPAQLFFYSFTVIFLFIHDLPCRSHNDPSLYHTFRYRFTDPCLYLYFHSDILYNISYALQMIKSTSTRKKTELLSSGASAHMDHESK